MDLTSYLSNLLTTIKDIRVARNVVKLVEKMIEHKTTRVWSISEDKREFERNKSLLDGSLKNGIDMGNISESMISQGIDELKESKRVILISDESDIRKPYSEKMGNLGKVRDLAGNIINGYNTFNTIALNEDDKVNHTIVC